MRDPHLEDLPRQRSIWTLLRARGHDDGDVEQLTQCRVRNHGVVVKGGIEVAGEGVETVLQVEDEEHTVVLVEAFEGDGGGDGGWEERGGCQEGGEGVEELHFE